MTLPQRQPAVVEIFLDYPISRYPNELWGVVAMKTPDWFDPSEAELTHLNADGSFLYISKIGGGTLGRKYDGNWSYVHTTNQGKVIHASQDDFVTGTPKTHHEVAQIIEEYLTGDK